MLQYCCCSHSTITDTDVFVVIAFVVDVVITTVTKAAAIVFVTATIVVASAIVFVTATVVVAAADTTQFDCYYN